MDSGARVASASSPPSAPVHPGKGRGAYGTLPPSFDPVRPQGSGTFLKPFQIFFDVFLIFKIF